MNNPVYCAHITSITAHHIRRDGKLFPLAAEYTYQHNFKGRRRFRSCVSSMSIASLFALKTKEIKENVHAHP